MNRKRYRSAARSWYGCHEIPAEWVGITSLSEALMLSSTCRKKVIPSRCRCVISSDVTQISQP